MNSFDTTLFEFLFNLKIKVGRIYTNKNIWFIFRKVFNN